MSDKTISVLMAADVDWGLVGSTVVTGLVIVFLILAILVFFLWGFGKIFKAINNASDKRERKKLIERNDAMRSFHLQNSADTSKTAPAPVPEPETVAEDEYEDEDDDEIIAVIAAAIAAYGAAEGKQYRITRVQRPKSARSGWSTAGIAENMRGFMN